MKWGRIKTILIYFLLTVILSLGGYLALVKNRENRILNEAIDNAVAILEENSVFIDRNDIPAEIALREVTVVRNTDTEGKVAKAILGGSYAERNDLGGGMVKFVSANGSEVFFRNGGYFEITLFSEDIKPSNITSAGNEVYKILSNGGIVTNRNDYFTEKAEDSDIYKVSVQFSAEKVQIFNSFADAEVSNGKVHISGRTALGDFYFSEQPQKPVYELLVLLSRNIRKVLDLRGKINISSIDYGKLIYDEQAGSLAVKPVWKITVGEDVIYLSTVDGEFD